ncbi:MAG: hypothetical protein F4X65_10955 [Chloroflexi bacterium]|nr:hypothetical protein [Chloroflexota bacterium]
MWATPNVHGWNKKLGFMNTEIGPIEWQAISYSRLNAKQKEIYNFQKAAAVLADYGFDCIKLADDWGGADFLAYNKDREKTYKVQLKTRASVWKKYKNKDLWMLFQSPVSKGPWYMIHHDKLLELVRQNTTWLESEVWEDGECLNRKPTKELRKALAPYIIPGT